MSNRVSALRPISIGKAAENLALGSHELSVYPMEILPFVEGEITTDEARLEDQGVDAFGKAYAVTTTLSNTIKAMRLRMGGNRATPENIRRGQRVMLYQLADDPEGYYWTYMGLDDHLFRKETVTHRWSNTDVEATDELTADNSVYMEVSTHQKTITLSTPTNDGEVCTFDIQLDYGDGILQIVDGIGNSLKWDATERDIILQNRDGSVLQMDKTHVGISTKETIQLDTKDFTVNTDTITVNAKTGNFNIDTVTFTGNDFTVHHESVFTKNVTVHGIITGLSNLIISGMAAITGALSAMGGAMSMSGGGAEIKGTLINNGVNVGSTHTHIKPGGTSSAPTSPPM